MHGASVLPTERIAHVGAGELAALRDFNPAYVINGPMATSALRPFHSQLRTSLGAGGTAEKCHVWTAPSWQELSSRKQHWSVQPCVRPLDAVHMTAGHNALRGSGPGQKLAFDNAMALVCCPDRRIDRLCITCCSPSQPSHHAGCPARSRLRRKCDGFLVSLALSHVWTAPSWQELSSRKQHWSVQPCVRPLDAVHMTAGHNALRGSGPDQKLAF